MAVTKEKAPFEDLSEIKGAFDHTADEIRAAGNLSEQGVRYLRALQDSIDEEIKSNMFHSLLNFMVATGRLKQEPPKKEEILDEEVAPENESAAVVDKNA